MRNACYNISELEDVHICMSNCICTRILPNIEFAYFALKLEDVSEEKFFAWADLEAMIISMVARLQFECCDREILDHYCEEYAMSQDAAINACMRLNTASILRELRCEYVRMYGRP